MLFPLLKQLAQENLTLSDIDKLILVTSAFTTDAQTR